MSGAISREQVDAALDRIPAHEWPLLIEQLQAMGAAGGASVGTYLALLRREDVSGPFKVALGMARMRRYSASDADASGLPPLIGSPGLDDELSSWVERIGARLLPAPTQSSRGGAPARTHGRPSLLPDLPDGRFIQLAHETMLGRGCQPHELVRWQGRLERGEIAREGLLEALSEEARRVAERDAVRVGGSETAFHVMGTGQRVTAQDWRARAEQLARAPAVPRLAETTSCLRLGGAPRLRISAITSLYAGGEHIERFLANMVGQSVFADHTELIVIDAQSPDGEQAVIERYRQRWPNIRYLRTPERIGIYEAWNLAVGMARGEYLTSANVDDLRRADSLEQQAALLEQLPFVDVVYQDFFYTLDPTLGFDEVAAFGFRSDLPLVTPHGLMAMNPPHNAPMWRRRLHDELGLFDSRLHSAGDYDFWMRCVLAGKTFYKLNDPHVVYFQNPRGISTRPDTRGYEETREVHRRYGRQLVADDLVIPIEEFRLRCGASAASAGAADPPDRQAIVHDALLWVARAAPRPSGRRGRERSADAPLRLLVDGIGWADTAGMARPWAALVAALVAQPSIELWWLDRGQTPGLPGLRNVPFPRHRRGACAADSLLIQQVCDLHRIDVFASTGWTTPVATPTLVLLEQTQDEGRREDPTAPAQRERALAIAFARQVVHVPPTARARTGDEPADLPALVIDAGHALRDHDRAGAFMTFFAEWRRLRELQARIDF